MIHLQYRRQLDAPMRAAGMTWSLPDCMGVSCMGRDTGYPFGAKDTKVSVQINLEP